MPRNLIRHIHILQPLNPRHRSQPRYRPHTSTRRPEQIIQHPIVPRESINEPPGDHTTRGEPVPLGRGDGGAEEEDVLYDSVGFLFCQFEQGVEYDAGAEGEAYEGDGAHAEAALEENVGEDGACCCCSVERV